MKISKKNIQQLSVFLGMCIVMTLSACKKEKVDFAYDNRPVTDVRKSSSVRVMNLAGFNQVLLEGDTLTNYQIILPTDPVTNVPRATLYFPEGGTLSSTWSVPQSLLKNGKATIQVETRAYNKPNDKLSLQLEEDASQPMDYYLRPIQRFGGKAPEYIRIPRDVTAPSDPRKFKVRILNLSQRVENSNMENLTGPMTLTWADGTPIDPRTSNIPEGHYSAYIELPYTTAQLKVLTSSGIQVPGTTNELIFPETSTLTMPVGWPPEDSNLTFAAFRNYAPGGVYTIVVSPYSFKVPYLNGNPGETVDSYQDAVRIINDISEPLNTTYGRVQAVNALPGVNEVSVTMNGQVMGGKIGYTANTEYQEYIVGHYQAEAKDANGQVLARTEFQLDPNTNFTLWLHPNAEGKNTITAVANNLSSIVPGTDATDDGTYLRNKLELPFSIRFLNLCPDLPYLTFSTNNGQAFPSVFSYDATAVNNLRPGVVPFVAPYVQLRYQQPAYEVMAFRSSPGVVPGAWASDITVLTGKELIARPELYVRNGLPNHEPGIYTIALVGSTKSSAPAGQKAKMIILKHTK
ncbi:hypothetical protein PBAL39_16861 [Pedobacter sp. BAL39]|uniref:DUF4397 domain-containing protein n=1 Tax=Pedobacter sp. BAL39 TaxID=391596 RepID=UPI0001559350|nr:DUF4397 domain-containing protein [Pedobacter sp. BAL39]EDM35172.1 hypothetical protein PBAL39_16861 [Pedobacter sp. BAL39]